MPEAVRVAVIPARGGSKGLPGALLAVIAVFGLAGCDGATQAQDAPALPQVSVMTLAGQDLVISEDLPARVAAVRSAEIRAQISGIVQRRLFEQGAEINAGTVLFQINPAPFKADVDSAAAALQRAEAVLARARIQIDRLVPLLRTEAISRQSRRCAPISTAPPSRNKAIQTEDM